MTRIAVLVAALLTAGCAGQPSAPALTSEQLQKNYRAIPLDGFSDGIKHWRDRNGTRYARYEPTQIVGIAENIVLLQRNNGGWIENRDPARIMSQDEIAYAWRDKYNSQSSFDNRNVYTQIEYLFAAYDQTHEPRYRDSALLGFEYILRMQNKNCGGWPHTVPGTQPYHGDITFADEVTSGVLRTLRKMESGSEPFSSLDAATRQRAGEARERGDACVLKLQVVQNGQLTGWAGQYDPRTLQPVQGRSFELPAVVSQESVEMARYLMSIPNPSPDVVKSIEGVMSWFDRSKLVGWKIDTITLEQPIRYQFHTAATDRVLVQDASAGPLWGRFYDLKDNGILLANRDGRRVEKYSDITHERRTGYAWYGTWPQKLLYEEYPTWKKRTGR